MAFSTPITATKEGGGSNTAGQAYVGYKEYSQFDGTNDGKIFTRKTKTAMILPKLIIRFPKVQRRTSY